MRGRGAARCRFVTTPLPGNFLRPLTIADYERLPEDTEIWWELQEGYLVMMAPRRTLQAAADGELRARIRPYLPDGLIMLPNIDVDLELVPPDGPGHVRRPNLIVIDLAAYDRANREDTLLRAAEVRLTGDAGYRDNGRVTGEFTTSVPFPVRFDLDSLDELTT